MKAEKHLAKALKIEESLKRLLPIWPKFSGDWMSFGLVAGTADKKMAKLSRLV